MLGSMVAHATIWGDLRQNPLDISHRQGRGIGQCELGYGEIHIELGEERGTWPALGTIDTPPPRADSRGRGCRRSGRRLRLALRIRDFGYRDGPGVDPSYASLDDMKDDIHRTDRW
jgi:hypothetical protein